MSGVQLTFDLQGLDIVERDLSLLLDRANDTTLLMQRFGEIILRGVQEGFEGHHAPDGSPWKRLSPAYEKWKTKRKGRNAEDILILNRILMGSIHPTVTRDEVVVGTNIEYAAIHQKGGTIHHPGGERVVHMKKYKAGKKKGKTLFAKKGKADRAMKVQSGPYDIVIPARPFLPESEDEIDMEAIRDVALEYFFGPGGV